MIVQCIVRGCLRTLPLELDDCEYVSDIAAAVGASTHEHACNVCIVHNGAILDPDARVEECGIGAGSHVRYFVRRDAMAVKDLFPLEGYTSGGTHVRLSGNFPDASVRYTVRFGTQEVTGQYLGPDTVLAVTPPHPPGPVSVGVRAGKHGEYLMSESLFTYVNRVVEPSGLEVHCVDKMSHAMESTRFASGSVH